MSTRYKKRPVTIDAVHWTDGNDDAIRDLCGDFFDFRADPDDYGWDDPCGAVFDELHNTWVGVRKGDWIICGLQGEFYPCRADVFQLSYEPANEPATTPLDKPRLSIDPVTGVIDLDFRTGPDGYCAKTITITGPLVNEGLVEVRGQSRGIGMWLLHYDADGELCGIEVA